MTKENWKTCVYTGRRIWSGDKVVQRFEFPDGSEIFFKGISRVWIGHEYEIADGKMSKRPVRTQAPRIDKPEWEAAETMVEDHNAEKRAEQRAAKLSKPFLRAAVEALTPLCKGLEGYEQRAFIQRLLNEINNVKPRKTVSIEAIIARMNAGKKRK